MPKAKVLQNCIDLVRAPYRGLPERYAGRRAVGYLCSYAPLELLHAAGLTPVRVVQSSAPVTRADAHLPSFCCALARATTERMLSGELGFLHGVLFAHSCDTMQCLADVWPMANGQLRVHTFSAPTVLDTAASRAYCIEELRRLARAIESDYGVSISTSALQRSIQLYNAQRRLLAELYSEPQQFSAYDRWALAMAGTLMPLEEHVAALEALLGAGSAPAGRAKGPRLYLVGAVLDDPGVLQLIAELDGDVVGDDLCTGSRYFDTLVDEDSEPYAALAERILRRAACPCKHSAQAERRSRLLRALQTHGVQGVIFVLPKFCEPHAFDYVPLSQAVEELGLGQLLIETDLTVPREALRTRLQAFIEMLQQQGGTARRPVGAVATERAG